MKLVEMMGKIGQRTQEKIANTVHLSIEAVDESELVDIMKWKKLDYQMKEIQQKQMFVA